uniref:Uncharacterized protein n=1 Tax=Clastoptera arizonana TaxID=38151 RepID=A0A1B6DWK8_9HEMI
MWKAALFLTVVCLISAENRIEKLKLIHELNVARRHAVQTTKEAVKLLHDEGVPFETRMSALERIIIAEKAVLVLMSNNWANFEYGPDDPRLAAMTEGLKDIKDLEEVPRGSSIVWYKRASTVLMKLVKIRMLFDGTKVAERNAPNDNSTKAFQTQLTGYWREVLTLMMTLQPTLETQNLTQTEKFNEFMAIFKKGSEALSFTWENWDRIRCTNPTVYAKLKESHDYMKSLGSLDRMKLSDMTTLEKFLQYICELHYCLLQNAIV